MVEERKLIFSAIVAGKNAKFARTITAKLFDGQDGTPFQVIQRLVDEGRLEERLREVRSGNYGKLCRCLPELIKVNPYTVTVEELERIHGIGPKTARFYVLWTRPDARCAALDIHVLRFLHACGIIGVPKSTPSAGATYRRLEAEFLKITDELGITAGELDRRVWAAGAKEREEEVWTAA